VAGKKVIVIAGPNGAGKTTFAEQFLPNEAACPVFVNADLIARGLNPFDPDAAKVKAGRLMLELLDGYARDERNFAFETTLSGTAYLRKIEAWRAAGYFVELIFIRLVDADLAVARVRQRVLEGGHGIPEATIRRRFAMGLRNFETQYKFTVDAWALYDGSTGRVQLLEEGQNAKAKS
jgi:predicted ABC-type ATPase